jgi:hypothetical protein
VRRFTRTNPKSRLSNRGIEGFFEIMGAVFAAAFPAARLAAIEDRNPKHSFHS